MITEAELLALAASPRIKNDVANYPPPDEAGKAAIRSMAPGSNSEAA